MRIGIDIDDTITNSWECLIPYYSHLFGIEEEVLRKSKPYYQAVSHLMTLEEYYKIMLPIYDAVIPQVSLKDNVKEVIDKLYDLGCEVIFITARGVDHSDAYRDSKEYLDKYKIRYKKIIVNAKDKAKICIDEKIDLFIDDSLRNVTAVNNVGIDTLLFETYYNKDCEDIPHVNNWLDIYSYVSDRGKYGE